jgi:biotin synthase
MNNTDGQGSVSPHMFANGLPEAATLAKHITATGCAAKALQTAADELRQEIHGGDVYLRGIIEFSNHCRNRCAYCGINTDNELVERYRMTPEEILATARDALRWGCTTVVLQSGDDPGFGLQALAEVVRQIKHDIGLAVTLSIGTRTRDELALLHEAGADRYLLRFETSDPVLFEAIHPDESFEQRIQCLRDLRDTGYQVGSGFMIGLPGWTPESIAGDIRFATELKLDMIGCGPFLSHPDTPLADIPKQPDTTLYYNVIALLRLCNPRAHIPATTAFDALDDDGRNRVLQCGANVFMPNLTPGRFRKHYQLYPNKPCVDEDGAACAMCVRGRLAALGRNVGAGPGHGLRP